MIEELDDDTALSNASAFERKGADFARGMLTKERLVLSQRLRMPLGLITVFTIEGEEPPEEGRKGEPLYAIQ